MKESRLQELHDLSRREKRLRDLSKHFEGVALEKQHPEQVKFVERKDEYRMESVFMAANHLSFGAWVRIASIIKSEWKAARDEFEGAQ